MFYLLKKYLYFSIYRSFYYRFRALYMTISQNVGVYVIHKSIMCTSCAHDVRKYRFYRISCLFLIIYNISNKNVDTIEIKNIYNIEVYQKEDFISKRWQ